MSKQSETIARLEAEGRIVEFRDCGRCGVVMPLTSEEEQCGDCRRHASYHPRGVKGQYLQPIHPAYEVSLHYGQHPHHDLTLATLDAMGVPYMVYTSKRDSIEVDWAVNLLLDYHPEWPIVVISAHGQYIEHWTGFDLAALNRIPAARAAAIAPPAEDEPGVPIEQEQAA